MKCGACTCIHGDLIPTPCCTECLHDPRLSWVEFESRRTFAVCLHQSKSKPICQESTNYSSAAKGESPIVSIILRNIKSVVGVFVAGESRHLHRAFWIVLRFMYGCEVVLDKRSVFCVHEIADYFGLDNLRNEAHSMVRGLCERVDTYCTKLVNRLIR